MRELVNRLTNRPAPRGGTTPPQSATCHHPARRSEDVCMLNTTPLRFALACGLATALGFGTPARTPAQQKAQTPTLIRNATLLTVTKGTLENSDLLIENGKIAKIGKGLTAPAGARVIDATGKYVLPGIIDCHSHSMIDAVNEGSLSVTSMCRIRDVLNPNDVDLYRAAARFGQRDWRTKPGRQDQVRAAH